MFGKLIWLMCFVAFVECQHNRRPPNNNNPSNNGEPQNNNNPSNNGGPPNNNNPSNNGGPPNNNNPSNNGGPPNNNNPSNNDGPPNENNPSINVGPSGGGHGPPKCNPRNCPHECRFGYVLDQNQCETCECNLDLCIGKTCPDCHVCAAVRSECDVEPCPLVADCVCKRPDCQRPFLCPLGYSGKGFGCTVCGICNVGNRIACYILKQILQNFM